MSNVFLIISIFWVCAEILRQVVRIRFHLSRRTLQRNFRVCKTLNLKRFFSPENLWRTFGFYNLWKSAGCDRKIPARMSKILVTFSELHHLGKQIPEKLEHFWFFIECEQKKVSRAVKLLSSYPEEFLLRKKAETTKKTVSILNDKLCHFEQLLFVRVAKTAWYESIGTFCEKYLQEAMSHYFSFLQFWSNKFSVWCWNGILRVQRKRLSSFFWNFRRHFPDFEQPFLRKNVRTGFYVISDTFCKKKTNNFNFNTSHWVSGTIFRKGWQNHFPFVRGHFLETKCFLPKTCTKKFLNFSSKKLATLRKKIPHCWRNCFWWARRNNVEKNNSSKGNCLLTNLLPTSGWNFMAVFPWLLSASSRKHFG